MPRCSHVEELTLHPIADELYQYRQARPFEPGAMDEAFLPKFSLPVISFRGAARVAGTLNKYQHPQVWFHRQIGVQGFGGVTAGQIIGQPLLDPANEG